MKTIYLDYKFDEIIYCIFKSIQICDYIDFGNKLND